MIQLFAKLRKLIWTFDNPVHLGPNDLYPCVTSGDGEPTLTLPAGSMYLRRDVPGIYISAGAGVWAIFGGGGEAGLGNRGGIWRYKNPTGSADPGDNVFRMNSLTPASVTALYISQMSIYNIDATYLFGLAAEGNRIYMQQQNNSSRATLFEISGPPVDNGTWWTFPVTVVATTGQHPTDNEQCGISILFV